VIFVDSNVPMYLIGADHPHKRDAERLLERSILDGERLVTDAEVLQELIHRYQAIKEWRGRGDHVFADFVLVMEGRIEPMFAQDVQRAAQLADVYPILSARDLVHLAVMERAGATAIVTADTAFDNLAGVERLDPADAEAWLPRFEDEDP